LYPSLRHISRLFLTLLAAALSPALSSAQTLPDAPSTLLVGAVPRDLPSIPVAPPAADTPAAPAVVAAPQPFSSSLTDARLELETTPRDTQPTQNPQTTTAPSDKPRRPVTATTGTQPHRILGLMPNYRSVSAGEIPPPPGFKQSFKIATRQAFDYSSFIFLGLTTASAYWEDSHPSLDQYNGGNAPFYAYLWRGLLDKTDGTYQSAWIFPTLLHEDTRYYALGQGSKWKRLGYAMSRVAVARTYSGHSTPNLAGLGGKVGAQAVSTTYYPAASEPFGVLATKFSYACARDMGFTVFREFYPDIAIHVLHRNP
jgi:hypothetical protein